MSDEPMADVNDPWARLERWLDEDPEISWAEVAKGHATRWCVRLVQTVPIDDDHPSGDRVIADAESETLEGAVDGALLLAREFKEGL